MLPSSTKSCPRGADSRVSMTLLPASRPRTTRLDGHQTAPSALPAVASVIAASAWSNARVLAKLWIVTFTSFATRFVDR
eukprot:1581096-Heterocapsa_arctica.AAC.1